MYETFWQILLNILSTENININSGIEKFLQISINILNIFTPYKKTYLRENNMSLMNKSLVNTYMKKNPG